MTYNEWLETMLAEIPEKYQLSPGFPMYDVIAAWALTAERLEKELEEAKLLLNPENLTGIELDTYIYDRTGLERVQGDFAFGTVTLTGSGTVPAGTIFIADSGVSFYTISDETITGSGDVDVVCNTMGAAGNVPAGAITTFSRTLVGFSAVTNAEAMTGGADKETDQEFLDRFYLRMRTPPASGNIYAYQEWALEIAGVGAVKVFPLGHGDGTVDVVITSDSGGVADETLIAKVQTYIDPGSTGEGRGVAPIGASCYVSSAIGREISVSATVTLDGTVEESDVDAAIQEEISKILSKTFNTGIVSYGSIANAIFDADGVSDVQSLLIDNGMVSFAIGDTESAAIGTWEINYEYA